MRFLVDAGMSPVVIQELREPGTMRSTSVRCCGWTPQMRTSSSMLSVTLV